MKYTEFETPSMEKLIREQTHFLDRWKAGDRSDELVQAFCQLERDIARLGSVERSQKDNALVSEILEEESRRNLALPHGR